MGEPIDLDKAKKARRGAARRSAQPSADDTVVRRVEKMNVDYAFTLMGGKPVVLHEKTDFRGVPQVDFLGLDGFLRWWDKERVWDDETDKMIGVGHIWMRHPDRRDYLGVEFAPEGVPEGWFNLWRGFAVSPAAPYADVRQHATHFPRFSKHILENVAQGNRDVARWVWAFFAQMIQQPEKKPGTALALRGKQGCGKTKVGEVFGSLLARHWVKVAKPSHLTGNFNAHMFACLLLQAGDRAGSRQALCQQYHGYGAGRRRRPDSPVQFQCGGDGLVGHRACVSVSWTAGLRRSVRKFDFVACGVRGGRQRLERGCQCRARRGHVQHGRAFQRV